MPSRDALMLPDVLTIHNLEMPPMPDASFLSQLEDTPRKRRSSSRDINLPDVYDGSQFLPHVPERHFFDDELVLEQDDLDLGLDFGEDIVEGDASIEVGRDAPAPRPVGEDIFSDTEMGLQGKDIDYSIMPSIADDDGFRIDDDGDVDMGVGGDVTYNIGDEGDVPELTASAPARGRLSESPLSDIDPDVEHQLEQEISAMNINNRAFEPEDETEQSLMRNPAQRMKKRKVLQPDLETVISSKQIKEQQADRSNILQPQSFLPRDPVLLALQEMQRSGAFISNIMGSGRDAAWAPELRGMLSLDTIRASSNDLKRKRDSGIADMGSDLEAAQKSPRLDFGAEEDVFGTIAGDAALGRDDTLAPADASIMEIPAYDDEGFYAPGDDFDIAEPTRISVEEEDPDALDTASPGPEFDVTSAPLVAPADSGPVSQTTTHAVHLLRQHFTGATGAAANVEPSARQRTEASVLFQDLLPAATTSKADATKMFFEVLVLATKDAVKVEQDSKRLGAEIKVRGKRGLWGGWAEREAGGEIAEVEVVA